MLKFTAEFDTRTARSTSADFGDYTYDVPGLVITDPAEYAAECKRRGLKARRDGGWSTAALRGTGAVSISAVEREWIGQPVTFHYPVAVPTGPYSYTHKSCTCLGVVTSLAYPGRLGRRSDCKARGAAGKHVWVLVTEQCTPHTEAGGIPGALSGHWVAARIDDLHKAGRHQGVPHAVAESDMLV